MGPVLVSVEKDKARVQCRTVKRCAKLWKCILEMHFFGPGNAFLTFSAVTVKNFITLPHLGPGMDVPSWHVALLVGGSVLIRSFPRGSGRYGRAFRVMLLTSLPCHDRVHISYQPFPPTTAIETLETLNPHTTPEANRDHLSGLQARQGTPNL